MSFAMLISPTSDSTVLQKEYKKIPSSLGFSSEAFYRGQKMDGIKFVRMGCLIADDKTKMVEYNHLFYRSKGAWLWVPLTGVNCRRRLVSMDELLVSKFLVFFLQKSPDVLDKKYRLFHNKYT